MKKHRYIQKPEITFISGAASKLDIPEIEVRFSTVNRKEFGKIKRSEDAANFIRSLYPTDTIELQEQFYVLYLNRVNKIIGYYKHSMGGTAGTVVDTKIILAAAMKSVSSFILIAHNHPSGETKPSDTDIRITKDIKEAARHADIGVLDHIIVTRDSYYSFADDGLLGVKNTAQVNVGINKFINTILCGDVLQALKKIPSNSIYCVVTSPPYWQLRDYGWSGQWGLEPNYEDYLNHLWMFMDEIKRVLRTDGTVWINLGDTYGTQSGTGTGKAYKSASTIHHVNNGSVLLKGKTIHKSQLLIPHRFAIGCSERGWIIRNDIIWAKTNGMPESVKDRFAKKHEYIFFMTKSADYYFDLDSVRDKHKGSAIQRSKYTVTAFRGDVNNKMGALGKGGKGGASQKQMTLNPLGKNPGSVSDFWDIATKAGSDKHYAQYNTELITKPILAGCPEKGIVLDPFCGTGTTGVRALELGRNFIGIEGKKEYCRMAEKNLSFKHSSKITDTMNDLGKIVDTGTVPEYSSTDKYWGFQKEPQIIFNPEDKRFRQGIELPKNYVSHLKDTDLIPEFLRQHYAFKGFEFGNWTTQEDRQNYMMGLAISLYDLQHILGFDRHQIGFNGVLSLAFGSRGIPHTSGHFEPQTFVINLTRHSAGSFKYRADLQRRNVEYRHALLSRGLQSLAHEYGHALDYYCGTYVEPNSAKCLTGGMINWNVNVQTHYHLAGLMKNVMDKICYDAYGHSTEYIMRVKKHSNQKYLLQKNEIFARAFEKYINYKMKNKGWFNVFFTKFKYEEGKDKTVSYSYYLNDNELRAIEKDFDRLIDAISKSLKGVNKLISRSTVNYTVKKKGLGNLTDETRTDGVMTIDDAKKANFDLIGLQGKWLNLIGKACKPTHFFIYGIGGSGKSSFVLLFSQYLASLNYKILYVAGEQFGTPTFTELLNRLNIKAGSNFKIVDTLDRLNPHDFDFVVLDSKDNVGIELPTFRELKKQYPEQSFIILSQATKSGNFTGSEKWRNEVDVMLLADNGIIKSGIDKNRWGGAGEMKVFDRENVGELQGLHGTKKKNKSTKPSKTVSNTVKKNS